MAKDTTKQSWDTIWSLFDRVDRGHKLTYMECWEFADALRTAEAAQKEEAVLIYVRERLRQRRIRRKQARSIERG